MRKNSKRVLNREGARELTPRETENVSGSVDTHTMCSWDAITKQPDGDPGEC